MIFEERKAMPVGYVNGQPVSAADWNRMQQQNNPSLFTRIGRGISNAASSVGNAVSGAAQSVKESAVGTPGGFTQNPRFPEKFQGQYEDIYQSYIDRMKGLQQNPGGPNPSIDPILKQAEMDYYTKTVPAINESYTALGNQRSAGFPAAVTGSGQQFATNLAALKAQYGLDEQRQLMSGLQQSPYINAYQKGTQGWLPGAVDAGISAGGAALSSYFGAPATAGNPAAAGVAGLLAAISAIQKRRSRKMDEEDGGSAPQPYETQGPLSSFSGEQRSFLDNVSRGAAPGSKLTPDAIAYIQALTGIGGGAASDFQRTFKQPKPQRITFPRSPQEQAKFAGFNRAGVV